MWDESGAYELPPWEHPTDDSGYSSPHDLLPTPKARDWKGRDPNPKGVDLNEAIALLPTPTATPYGNNQSASAGVAVRPSLDALVQLLPTPRVAATRTSRGAAMRKDSLSGPSLDQAIELAQGVLPREFTSWDEMPASWIGVPTAPPSTDGN